MVEITGNTYPVRDQLRALGGKWDGGRKCWIVPADNADEARQLVSGAPKPFRGGTKPRSHSYPSGKACRTCGVKINYGVYCGKCEYA